MRVLINICWGHESMKSAFRRNIDHTNNSTAPWGRNPGDDCQMFSHSRSFLSHMLQISCE